MEVWKALMSGIMGNVVFRSMTHTIEIYILASAASISTNLFSICPTEHQTEPYLTVIRLNYC